MVLLTGVCLAFNGIYAQQSSTANRAPKPAGHSPVGSTPPTATHLVAKKAASPATTSHSAANQRTALRPGAAPSAATKTAPHTSTAYATKGTPNHTTARVSQRGSSSTHTRYSTYRRTRTLSWQQRMAHLHLQPERVQEIQQALIREGYLQGDANGQWDAPTREAMLRYQTMNGFPATGLPEAKSLMKLGRGSHPLPAELDHGPAGAAGPGGAPGDLTASPSPPVSRAVPPSEPR